MNAPGPDGLRNTTTHSSSPAPRSSGLPARPEHRSGVDRSRPFGAHLRMSWWQPLVLIVVLPMAMLILQVLLYQLAGLIEGSDDALAADFTPLRFLAANLSIGATGLLAILLLVRMTGAPWRSLLSSPRSFDQRRFAHHLAGAALLVGAGLGAVALIAPEAPGWTAFGISGTTIAMLVVILFTTPMQAAGEELLYRSAVLPAAASWVRAVRPALVVGLVVSSLGFAALHGSTDPWLFGYYVVVGVATGLMAIISGGIEAPIAFHIANNVLATTVNSLMSDGEILALDRTTDTGDPSLLILVAVNNRDGRARLGPRATRPRSGHAQHRRRDVTHRPVPDSDPRRLSPWNSPPPCTASATISCRATSSSTVARSRSSTRDCPPTTTSSRPNCPRSVPRSATCAASS